MIPILTLSLVLLGVGLTLLVMAMRRTGGDGQNQAETSPQGRRFRPIPLVIGVLLSLTGAAGASWVLAGDPDDFDQMVLSVRPAGWLVTDLNSSDVVTRQAAFHELNRRLADGSLSESAHRRLVSRRIAAEIGDRSLPDAPSTGAPIIGVDIVAARKENLLSAKDWTAYIARTAPLRLDIPRTVALAGPLALRLDASLQDHTAPAWVMIRVDSLTIGGKEVQPPPAVAVAPNPEWRAPPPPEPVDTGDAPQTMAPGGGGGQRPPVVRRVVRYTHELPADLLAGLGEGTFPVKASITVYAFDSSDAPPPLDLMNDAATGVPRRGRAAEDLQAAVLSAQLTAEQVEQLRPKAPSTHKWEISRDLRIGEAPSTQQSPGEQPQQPQQAAGEQRSQGE